MIRHRFAAILAALCLGSTGAMVATNYTREDAHPITAGTDAEWAQEDDDCHASSSWHVDTLSDR